MQQISIYRVLTFVLLPFAALFGCSSLLMLLIGLANPVMLLPTCIMICFCIYTIACMIFLIKGIGSQKQCKPSLKDWIKVNGYVTAVMGVMSLLNSVTLLFYPRIKLIEVAKEMLATQAMKPQGMTIEAVVSIMIVLSYVMLVFSIVLLVQLILSFRLLKKYEYLFGVAAQ